jgi:type IV secretion system protein VirB10
LTKDAPVAGVIAAAAPGATPVAAQTAAPSTPPAWSAMPLAGMIGGDAGEQYPLSGGTPGGGTQTPVAAQPSALAPRPPMTPMEQEAERQRQLTLQEAQRIRQRKQQFYEQALISPTRTASSPSHQQGGVPNAPAGSMANFQPGASHPPIQLPSALDLQKALAGLGGAGAGAPGGMAAGAQGDDQGSKAAFLTKDRAPGYLLSARQAPISKYELKTGSVIPAVLITGINSDLPGEILAQVSQNVYDSASGNFLLIPQGTKLYGTYDSRIVFGQKRVLQVWTRLIFPDGSTLNLQNMSGVDQPGYSGFTDKVNNHYVQLFGSALLLSLFSAGIQLSQPASTAGPYATPTAGQTIAASVGQEMGQVGTQLMQRQMNVQPTLIIRPGYKFNVMVNKDIVLEPMPATATE